MHAYGHQWSCQLIYNPRLRQGLGLSDGEGVERIWSRRRKLIPIERSQWVSNLNSSMSTLC
jgi:Kyakuja-Dileera-Zisupton transposase